MEWASPRTWELRTCSVELTSGSHIPVERGRVGELIHCIVRSSVVLQIVLIVWCILPPGSASKAPFTMFLMSPHALVVARSTELAGYALASGMPIRAARAMGVSPSMIKEINEWMKLVGWNDGVFIQGQTADQLPLIPRPTLSYRGREILRLS